MSFDIYEQYDKIYRYCFLKVRHKETAETTKAWIKHYSFYTPLQEISAPMSSEGKKSLNYQKQTLPTKISRTVFFQDMS